MGREALAKYSDIIDLSIGDTDFTTDEAIIEKAYLDAKAGHTHYGDPKGDPELIAAAEKACADAGVKALVGKIATGDLFVGDSETKAAIEAKCAPDCVEMEGAAVSQIAAKNGVPCVILRAMSDNADEDGHEVLVVKKFSIAEYVATATRIVAAMVEAL